MPKDIIEIGKKYGKLTVLGEAGVIKKRRMVMFECECGSKKSIVYNAVKMGRTKSCGCIHNFKTGKTMQKHGLHKHPIYKLWHRIRNRCNNPNNVRYESYGGSGVKVCHEWDNDFMAFYDWCIKNGWAVGLEIDKDKKAPGKTGKLYSPEFCCFLTRLENSHYKTQSVRVTHNGETKSIQEWADIFNLRYKHIQRYIQVGWTLQEILDKAYFKRPRKAA